MIRRPNVSGDRVRPHDRPRNEAYLLHVLLISGAVPENSKQYYGFTRFAIELNELDDDLRQQLPPTDTRFRPDQRYDCSLDRLISIAYLAH